MQKMASLPNIGTPAYIYINRYTNISNKFGRDAVCYIAPAHNSDNESSRVLPTLLRFSRYPGPCMFARHSLQRTSSQLSWGTVGYKMLWGLVEAGGPGAPLMSDTATLTWRGRRSILRREHHRARFGQPPHPSQSVLE